MNHYIGLFSLWTGALCLQAFFVSSKYNFCVLALRPLKEIVEDTDHDGNEKAPKYIST